MRRVVVTGIGIWSCIGHNRQEVTQALRTGRSGIGYDFLIEDARRAEIQ